MTNLIDLDNLCGECNHIGTEKCSGCLRTAIHDLVCGNNPIPDLYEKESWAGLKLIDTHEDAFGNEYEVFKCGCGRTHTVQSGGDIACCPCEFEHEGEPVNTKQNPEPW